MEEVKTEQVKTNAPGFTEDVKNLVENYIDLAKANVTQKAADVASVSITGFVVAMLAIFAVFFAGAGLAWWLGELLNNMILGFLIVAGLFVLIIVILLAFKEKLLYSVIRNTIVRKVYE